MNKEPSQKTLSNAVIHLSWIIVLLILSGAALVSTSPDGIVIRDYISFASAISSIALAIVAIFYSMISNQSFSQTIGALNLSANKIDSTAREINTASLSLKNGIDDIIVEFKELHPVVKEISEKFDNQFNPMNDNIEKSISAPDIKNHNQGMISVIPAHGAMMTIYALAQAHKNKYGKFSFQDLYAESDVWINYSSGAVEIMRAISPRGLKIDRTKKNITDSEGNEKEHYFHEVIESGDFDFDEIIEIVEEQENSSGDNEYQMKIRNFFMLQKS